MLDYSSINLSVGNTDFSILFSPNFQNNDEDWSAPEHRHLFCECHFLISGRISLKALQEDLTIDEGSFCVLPKNVMHHVETISKPTRKLSFYITIVQNKATETDTFSRYKQIFLADRLFTTNRITVPFSMLSMVADHLDPSDFIQKSELKNFFSWVLLELLKETEGGAVSAHTESDITYDDALALIIEDFLINNFDPDIQLDDLANYLCLSGRQTNRLLKKLFNQSFHDIKASTRIAKAKELIEQKEQSLKDIGEYLGFDSYSGFYKAFRAATGLTPEEFRIRNHAE